MPAACSRARGRAHPDVPGGRRGLRNPRATRRGKRQEVDAWRNGEKIAAGPRLLRGSVQSTMMAPMAKKTLYHILGVPRDASATDIENAHQMRAAELER